ncbi:hypothetical protein SAMN05216573_1053 [Bradyrhizobium sp. Rc3b]|nr:hypothetical protein SAMN05216573_1053 [Bradyrhizobium sp. Rc3b]
MSLLDILPGSFKARPTGIWIDETVARIKETAQPELIESLFRNRIPKDARFLVLRHLITVDGTKRPEGHSCPCPMCNAHRFLTASLVWFPGSSERSCAFRVTNRLTSGWPRCPVSSMRLRAICNASLVRLEVACASAWATTARTPMVRSLGSGMSQQTNFTPLSLKANVNNAEREILPKRRSLPDHHQPSLP